jgi:hypothetical protein
MIEQKQNNARQGKMMQAGQDNARKDKTKKIRRHDKTERTETKHKTRRQAQERERIGLKEEEVD